MDMNLDCESIRFVTSRSIAPSGLRMTTTPTKKQSRAVSNFVGSGEGAVSKKRKIQDELSPMHGMKTRSRRGFPDL